MYLTKTQSYLQLSHYNLKEEKLKQGKQHPYSNQVKKMIIFNQILLNKVDRRTDSNDERGILNHTYLL